VAVKLALVEPAATVTEPGTVSSEPLLEDKLIEAPPLGAAAERLTMQDVNCPELRLLELHVIPVNVGNEGADSWIVAV
jgi:hypothetical protein